MEWGNLLLAIGFLVYGTSFSYDDFWSVVNDMTASVLNLVAIISIVTGTYSASQSEPLLACCHFFVF